MGNCCSTEGPPQKEESSVSSNAGRPKASRSKQKAVVATRQGSTPVAKAHGSSGGGGGTHQHHPQQTPIPPPVSASAPAVNAAAATASQSTLQLQQQPSQPPSAMVSIPSNKERDAMLADPSISLSTKLILSAPFALVSRFTEHIFLSGLGGVTLESLKQHNIKCLVNVAQEVANYSPPPGMLCYKFPLVDSYNMPITDTLHSSADLMFKLVKTGHHGNVLVYCTAGMSRSAAIVLAYAVKHLRAPLKQSFSKLQETRTYARPNLAFFQQLVAFEAAVLGTSSTRMVAETLDIETDGAEDADVSSDDYSKEQAAAKAAKAAKPRKVPKPGEPSITVPDFLKKDYPHLFKMEVEEALAGNCPMAHNIGAATVASLAATSSAGMSSAVSCLSATSAVSKPAGQGGKSSVGGGGGKMAISNSHSSPAVYQNHELKPFVLEPISYPTVLAEIAKSRKKMKPTTATTATAEKRNTSPLSLKKAKK